TLFRNLPEEPSCWFPGDKTWGPMSEPMPFTGELGLVLATENRQDGSTGRFPNDNLFKDER
ncbi:MAG: hypothetical protein JW795_15545, partial [Chitinivibrionales bacterium]|nr:hypothetical protein [Chitinivibrionales bacterium]